MTKKIISDLNKGLEKGSDALLVGVEIEEYNEVNSIYNLKCENISPNPYQPRNFFNEDSIQELSNNIKEYGVIQPILVSKIGNDNYQLIAGERRLRAAKLANLKTIPAIIKQMSAQQQSLLALIENIQREELNCIEEAHAFYSLQKDFYLTHEQISQQVGKSRSHITNLLRLLNLSQPVQNLLLNKKIEMGHARALVGQEKANQLGLANLIIKNNWSVRDIEKHLKTNTHTHNKRNNNLDMDILNLQEELIHILGVNININIKNEKQGSIVIDYSSLEDFDIIIKQLKKK